MSKIQNHPKSNGKVSTMPKNSSKTTNNTGNWTTPLRLTKTKS